MPREPSILLLRLLRLQVESSTTCATCACDMVIVAVTVIAASWCADHITWHTLFGELLGHGMGGCGVVMLFRVAARCQPCCQGSLSAGTLS